MEQQHMTKKVTLTAWAAERYDPSPSLWVLRKWVRNGEIHPPAEMVGKCWYVAQNAKRITGDMGVESMSLVDRLKSA